MATNLQIDDKLIQKAVDLGRHRTKREALTAALTAYVNHLQQHDIIAEFGSVDYDSDYDYKKQRARK